MSPVKIGVLISGSGTNLQAIIDNIENGNINGEIKLIISNKKFAYGLTRGEIARIETKYLDSHQFTNEEYNQRLIDEFNKKGIDLIILAGYLKVLSKDFIDAFRGRIINIHPSLIPSFCGKNYYGSKVHEEVIKAGVRFTGATVHFVDEGTDTGPIILQAVVPVHSYDTVDSLKDRVLDTEHIILVEAVRLYCENKISLDGRRVLIKES